MCAGHGPLVWSRVSDDANVLARSALSVPFLAAEVPVRALASPPVHSRPANMLNSVLGAGLGLARNVERLDA